MQPSKSNTAAKIVVNLALAAATAGPADAQGRPSTLALTCRSAASLVAQRGAIVLGTGGQTYDRFVSNETFCPVGLYARPAAVPTRDNPQCVIGFYCTGLRPLPF
jgi:hypothetical protein